MGIYKALLLLIIIITTTIITTAIHLNFSCDSQVGCVAHDRSAYYVAGKFNKVKLQTF